MFRNSSQDWITKNSGAIHTSNQNDEKAGDAEAGDCVKTGATAEENGGKAGAAEERGEKINDPKSENTNENWNKIYWMLDGKK